MGFALKGFLMGAATAVSEKIDVDQKQAEEAGKLSALNLHKVYEENKKRNEIQIKDKAVQIKLNEVNNMLSPLGKTSNVGDEELVNLLQYFALLEELIESNG